MLCTRAVRADGYCCVAHFTAQCTTVHTSRSTHHDHACDCMASSGCDKPAALLILLYSSRSKKWSGHGLTGPAGSYAYAQGKRKCNYAIHESTIIIVWFTTNCCCLQAHIILVVVYSCVSYALTNQ